MESLRQVRLPSSVSARNAKEKPQRRQCAARATIPTSTGLNPPAIGSTAWRGRLGKSLPRIKKRAGCGGVDSPAKTYTPPDKV